MKITSKFCSAAALSLATTLSAFAGEAPKIAAIHAQLYYDVSGKFSDDILARKELSLWNTIIGEGDSGGASNFTLVTVEVQGKDVPVGAVKVHVIARGNKRKILAERTIHVALYDEKTTFYAPLWLYDSGCEAVEVSARLVGKGAPTTVVKKTIPFACGE